MKSKVASLSGFLAPHRLVPQKRSSSRDSSLLGQDSSLLGQDSFLLVPATHSEKESKFVRGLADRVEEPHLDKEESRSVQGQPSPPPLPRASRFGKAFQSV